MPPIVVLPNGALDEWFHSRCDWPDAVLPAYSGGSVANIAATIFDAFQTPERRPEHLLLPLRADVLDPALLADVRVVVLIVVDGLSEALSRRAREAGVSPWMSSAPVRSVLTSTFPSTTTAALTSLQTGVAPSRHGLAGYTLFLPAAERVLNMIKFKPVDGGALKHGAPDPRAFMPVPTIYDVLARSGIESVVVSHREYADSPLTRLQMGAVPYVGHVTLADFAVQLARQANNPGKRFVFGYWAGLDMLGHARGPDSLECLAEVASIDDALRRWFFERLDDRAAQDVVVIVTADHGQITVPLDQVRATNDIPSAVGAWRHPLTGERRVLGMSFANDDTAAPSRLDRFAGEDGLVLDTREALASGLFGPEPHHPEVLDRIGSTLLLARGGATFLHRSSRAKGAQMLGAHGSLTAEEMLAPLFVWREGLRSS